MKDALERAIKRKSEAISAKEGLEAEVTSYPNSLPHFLCREVWNTLDFIILTLINIHIPLYDVGRPPITIYCGSEFERVWQILIRITLLSVLKPCAC